MSENEVRYIHQKTSGEEQGTGEIEEPKTQPYFPSEEEERLGKRRTGLRAGPALQGFRRRNPHPDSACAVG